MGERICATKAFSQYTWSVRTRAINKAETVLTIVVMRTVQNTGMRLTNMPVRMLVIIPATKEGST